MQDIAGLLYAEGQLSVLDQPEVSRRLRAVLAYAQISRGRAAELLSVNTSTLDRWTSGRSHYRPDVRQLWLLADAAGLPREWFVADLARLHEIVPEGLPVFVRSPAGVLLEAPPGELGQIARGSRPIPPSQGRSESPPGKDARGRSETG